VRRDERGVILVALLWILVALTIIALSFARESFVEVAAARNSRDLAQAYYVARAGIAATVFQLWQKRYAPPVKGIELQGPPNPIDLGKVSGTIGGGVYEVEIQDESAKIDITRVSEEQLRALVEAVGIQKPDSDVIVDSILDWRDPDNLHRLSGAEDDYYQTLNPPYKAKNGRLDTVEELLLVRGVTPDYFYGHQELGPDGTPAYRYGLSRCFTVYSNRPQININYAPLPVLLSIPGMPPEAAQLIYQRRQVKPFQDLQEITKELPVNLGTTTQYLSTTDTGMYTFTSYAHLANSKVRRVIRAVISLLDMREPNRYKVLYWNENVPNL
jgi:general secretion pathway protein K